MLKKGFHGNILIKRCCSSNGIAYVYRRLKKVNMVHKCELALYITAVTLLEQYFRKKKTKKNMVAKMLGKTVSVWD